MYSDFKFLRQVLKTTCGNPIRGVSVINHKVSVLFLLILKTKCRMRDSNIYFNGLIALCAINMSENRTSELLNHYNPTDFTRIRFALGLSLEVKLSYIAYITIFLTLHSCCIMYANINYGLSYS